MSETLRSKSKWHSHLDMSFLAVCWHLYWKFILKIKYLFPTVVGPILG